MSASCRKNNLLKTFKVNLKIDVRFRDLKLNGDGVDLADGEDGPCSLVDQRDLALKDGTTLPYN